MFGQFLTPEARVIVEEMRGNTRDKGAYMKLSVLILLDMGKGYDEIELILGIGRGTITNCRQKYEKEGLDKYLDRHYVPYCGKLAAEALQQIGQQVSNNIYSTSQEIQAYILEVFGVDYSLSAVRSILEKLGFVYKKTSELPGNFDAAEQAAFLAEMQLFLADMADNEVVLFADAVHPQHNTRSSYAWIKKGQEKFIPSNTGRRRLNINGAMNAHHPQEVVIHEADTINADATIALYDKIQQRYANKDRIYVIGDNARYYRNAQLQAWLTQNPRIIQVFLPPYSPNLNLIERLWKLLRKKCISTHYYPDFKDFRQAILNFFEHLGQYKKELDTLITFKFQRLGNPDAAQPVFITTLR